MVENQNNNLGFITIGWLNYVLHYALSEPILQKVALLGSIASSCVYIYIQYKKNKNEKINKQRNP